MGFVKLGGRLHGFVKLLAGGLLALAPGGCVAKLGAAEALLIGAGVVLLVYRGLRRRRHMKLDATPDGPSAFRRGLLDQLRAAGTVPRAVQDQIEAEAWPDVLLLFYARGLLSDVECSSLMNGQPLAGMTRLAATLMWGLPDHTREERLASKSRTTLTWYSTDTGPQRVVARAAFEQGCMVTWETTDVPGAFPGLGVYGMMSAEHVVAELASEIREASEVMEARRRGAAVSPTSPRVAFVPRPDAPRCPTCTAPLPATLPRGANVCPHCRVEFVWQ